jgi:hypothetical protein
MDDWIYCPNCGSIIPGVWDKRNEIWVYHCRCGYELTKGDD